MSLIGTEKSKTRFMLTVTSILVFGWLITVGIALGQHDAAPESRGPLVRNIKGTVVSANKEEVTVKADDEKGQVVVAKVPIQLLLNGKRLLDRGVSQFVAKLEPGDKVDLDYATYYEMSFIRFIEKAGEASGVFQREGPLVAGWVISATENDVTIETSETATIMVLRVSMRRGDDGKWVRNANLARKTKGLSRGQLVLVKYRLTDEKGIHALQETPSGK